MDRNRNSQYSYFLYYGESLSARRAWIEIIDDLEPSKTRRLSLSARRAWIEIVRFSAFLILPLSLSARRAWIEILWVWTGGLSYDVALRKESVDRNH